MKLSECKLGEVVTYKDNIHDSNYALKHLQIGHIVGFTLNFNLETVMGLKPKDMNRVSVVPLIKFPLNDSPIGVHPGNLVKYQD